MDSRRRECSALWPIGSLLTAELDIKDVRLPALQQVVLKNDLPEHLFYLPNIISFLIRKDILPTLCYNFTCPLGR